MLKEKEREETEMKKKLQIGLGTSNPQQGVQEGDVNHNPWWTTNTNTEDLATRLKIVEAEKFKKEEAEAKKAKKEKKAKKKEKKRTKEKIKEAKKEGKLVTSSGKTLDDLRRERLERETNEKARASDIGRVVEPDKKKKVVSRYSGGYAGYSQRGY